MLIASYIFNTTAILYQFPYCVHLESHKPPDICIHRVPPHLQHYNTSSPSPCPLRSFLAFHKNGGAVHSFIVRSPGGCGERVCDMEQTHSDPGSPSWQTWFPLTSGNPMQLGLVGQRSRGSSQALPPWNSTAAAVRSWRGCEQLPGA